MCTKTNGKALTQALIYHLHAVYDDDPGIIFVLMNVSSVVFENSFQTLFSVRHRMCGHVLNSPEE